MTGCFGKTLRFDPFSQFYNNKKSQHFLQKKKKKKIFLVSSNKKKNQKNFHKWNKIKIQIS